MTATWATVRAVSLCSVATRPSSSVAHRASRSPHFGRSRTRWRLLVRSYDDFCEVSRDMIHLSMRSSLTPQPVIHEHSRTNFNDNFTFKPAREPLKLQNLYYCL